LHRAVVDQQPPGDPDRNVVDGQHGGVFTGATGERNPIKAAKSLRRFSESPSWLPVWER
jgi:hypothetical protein